jgi:hypothetical protein
MGYHKATFPDRYEPGGEYPLSAYAGDLTVEGEMATAPVHALMRKAYRELASYVVKFTPPGREASLALTTLQESLMWANAAIAMQAPLVRE